MYTFTPMYLYAQVYIYAYIDVRTCIYKYIYVYIYPYKCLLISMLWHRQEIFESKGERKVASSAEYGIRTQGLRHQIVSRLNAR